MKSINRRNLIKTALGTTTLIAFGSTQAETCKKNKTPKQPEGPFYPIDDQLDTDADLVLVEGAESRAKGEVIYIEGVVTDQNCKPVSGVLVEIWQACQTGRYNHPSDPNDAELDPNFQYWGKAVTNQDGNYRFRTIIPGSYPAGDDWVRPPHIHFKISKLGYLELITQMYFAGEQLNNDDLILNRLPIEERKKVIVPLKRHSFVDTEPLTGEFNISIEKLKV